MLRSFRTNAAHIPVLLRSLGPGLAVSALTATAAQFLSEHYGAPAMLMALLLGLSLSFLSDEGARTRPGVDYTARNVLRFGVALMGTRISVETLAGVGWQLIVVVLTGVVCTIGLGLLGARALGRSWSFGLLSGGSVAICGASAAMAIAAIMPEGEKDERDLLFTVLSVTLLSTLAMIAYPMIATALHLDARMAGVFLGGTIHDVAQVVGAGFSMGSETGEFATLIKLIRVATLAPVVLVAGMAFSRLHRSASQTRNKQPILPGFVLGFLVLAAVNSIFGLTEPIAQAANFLSRAALLIAIAAVGMKTSLRQMVEIGGGPILLIVGETLFLGGFVLIALHFVA